MAGSTGSGETSRWRFEAFLSELDSTLKGKYLYGDVLAKAMRAAFEAPPERVREAAGKAYEKLLSRQPTMKILRGGKLSATVKKAMALFKQKFSIKVEGGAEREAQGNVLKHEYQITSGGKPVATISKKWFSLDDTYGIALAPGQDEVLLLCAAICIDEMAETPG